MIDLGGTWCWTIHILDYGGDGGTLQGNYAD